MRPPRFRTAVAAQLDMLRERFADLEESGTPLVDGDYAEIDVKGYVHDESIEGLTATDLYEVGSGLVVPELDTELHGKRPGDILGRRRAPRALRRPPPKRRCRSRCS